MTVQELIDELRDFDGDVEVEVTIPIPGLDAEQVLTDFTLISQNGRFTIHATS